MPSARSSTPAPDRWTSTCTPPHRRSSWATRRSRSSRCTWGTARGRVLGLDRADEVLDTARVAAHDAGVDNVEFAVGDVYALDLPDASFDVVHAHQVLQHLTDPVAALREMRRVCAPGGVVAARDSDYATFTWWPEDPRLTRWLELYHEVARANGAEPDAGRRLLAWAHEAGFTDVQATASVWCFA